MSMTPSQLSRQIEPFYVMEVVKKAEELAHAGREVIHLSIGEPDFAVPEPVKTRLTEALNAQQTRYTAALGLTELRHAISRHYQTSYGVEVPPEQVIVTSGASAALMYAGLALINPGDSVGLSDPGYPCNKTFVQIAGGKPLALVVSEINNFLPTPADIQAALANGAKGFILASPSNPTGTRIEQAALQAMLESVWQHKGFLIMDEIYQELVYDSAPTSVLQLKGAPTDAHPFIVVNSFSKYFGMTGLRLGWMVVPPGLIPAIEKLAQNLAICPNTPAQYAALACFEPETRAICESRRQTFAQRRQLLLDQLPTTGLRLASNPDGAFYLYLRAPYASTHYCLDLLEATGVCTVPGKDFSNTNGQEMFRLSYANSTERIAEGLRRMARFNAQI